MFKVYVLLFWLSIGIIGNIFSLAPDSKVNSFKSTNERIQEVCKEVINETLSLVGLTHRMLPNALQEIMDKILESTVIEDDPLFHEYCSSQTDVIHLSKRRFVEQTDAFRAIYAYYIIRWLQFKNYFPNLITDSLILNEAVACVFLFKYDYFSWQPGIFFDEEIISFARGLIEKKLKGVDLYNEMSRKFASWLQESENLWPDDDRSPTIEEAISFRGGGLWERFQGVVLASFAYVYANSISNNEGFAYYIQKYLERGRREINLLDQLVAGENDATEKPLMLKKPSGDEEVAEEVVPAELPAEDAVLEVSLLDEGVQDSRSQLAEEKTLRGHTNPFPKEWFVLPKTKNYYLYPESAETLNVVDLIEKTLVNALERRFPDDPDIRTKVIVGIGGSMNYCFDDSGIRWDLVHDIDAIIILDDSLKLDRETLFNQEFHDEWCDVVDQYNLNPDLKWVLDNRAANLHRELHNNNRGCIYLSELPQGGMLYNPYACYFGSMQMRVAMDQVLAQISFEDILKIHKDKFKELIKRCRKIKDIIRMYFLIGYNAKRAELMEIEATNEERFQHFDDRSKDLQMHWQKTELLREIVVFDRLSRTFVIADWEDRIENELLKRLGFISQEEIYADGLDMAA